MKQQKPLLEPRLDKAIRVAAWAHREQVRKSTGIPYIVHPFAVMTIANRATSDEDVLIACLFHDILEDVPEQYSRERMHAEFGERVVCIVDGVTKDSSIADWRERSEAYLAHLQGARSESVIVSAADKIHNLQSTLIDYELHGENIWERFNSGKREQLWWYTSILRVLSDRMPDSVLTAELSRLILQLQKIVS